MRIAFTLQSSISFHGNTLLTNPLGGTETGLIRISESLAKRGHEVFVFTNREEPAPVGKVLYLPFQALADLGEVDVHVVVRDWQGIFLPIMSRKRFFWTGDSYDQQISFGLGDPRVIDKFNGFFAVSAWHRETYCSASGFPLEKTFVLGNGISLELFAPVSGVREPKLIYSSTPYRGLEYIPKLFSEVRKQVPHASIHVFSGFEVYGGEKHQPQDVVQKFHALKEILNKTPGVILRGNVTQAVLAKEFSSARLLFYPNIFEETSCITALEAQAGGAAIITTKLGALPETVGSSGVCLPGLPHEKKYQTEFVKSAVKILTDDTHFFKLQAAGLKQTVERSWDKIAKRAEEFFS